MKRQRSSESISPNSSSDDKNQESNPADEEGCSTEESCQVSEKKTRLSIDQVRALERNFEAENKLDPERKVKLAREVGLQPRQVAIWFQNRRARYKTKELEKDYTSLKADFDGLRVGYEQLQRDNKSLLQEVRELKTKLNESSSKQREMEEKIELQPWKDFLNDKCKEVANKLDFDKFNEFIPDMKDGSSDTGSSAILNEVNNSSSNNDANSQNSDVSYKKLNFRHLENHVSRDDHEAYLHHPSLKFEGRNFFDEELIFVGDQTPTLHWYLE